MLNGNANDEWIIGQAAQQGFGPNSKASIAIIYTVFGPAVGGILTSFAFVADFQYRFPIKVLFESPIAMLFDIFEFVASAVIAGYFFGGFQAAACGILLMTMSDRNARFSYIQAGLAPILVAIISAALIVFIFDAGIDAALFLVAAGPPTSLILRFLFRKRFAPVRRT